MFPSNFLQALKILINFDPHYAHFYSFLCLTSLAVLRRQVAKEAEKLLSFYPSCRMVCMTGGVPWEVDLQSLDGHGAVLLIATPGRLQSHVPCLKHILTLLQKHKIE